MRIAVITEQCLGRVPGGTGRYTRELAAALAATAAPGDEVVGWVAAHPKADLARAEIPGVGGPRRLSMPPRVLPLAWARGVGPAPSGVAVVHAPTLLVPPRWPATPLVVTIHDAVPWSHPETMTPHGVRWHRHMAARAARYARAIVVPTHAVATELAAHVDFGDRVHVIGEGVSEAVLHRPADAAERAERLGLPPDYLLAVATLEPRKGLDTALDALARLTGAAAELPLLVVGQPGWGGVSLVEAAAARGLNPDRVRGLGRLADPDLAVVYAQASVFLAPSRAEGFGLPVLEAMAHRLPVVITDVPALVEVAGAAATVVPIDDAPALAEAITQLVDDPARRASRATAGARRATQFSWSTTATQLWRLYQTVA